MASPFTLVPGTDAGVTPLAGLPAADLLLEIGEIVGVRMAGLLPQALAQAAASLNRQAQQAIDLEKRLLFLEAGRLAQLRLGHLPEDFRRHFHRRYPEACRRDPWRRPILAGLVVPEQLRIVDEERLEAALDASELVRALEDGCQQPLHGLLQQFRRLLQDPELPAAALPIGPRVLAPCLTQALDEVPSARPPKLKVLQALCLHLPPLMKDLYRDLCGHVERQLTPSAPQTQIGLPDLPEIPIPAACLKPDAATEGITRQEASAPAPVTSDDEGSTRARVRQEVQARLSRQAMPEAVQVFLQRYWQAWLEKCLHHHGADSEPWRTALETMDEVVRSLSPQPGEPAQCRLRRLPALLLRLRAGMDAVGIPVAERDRFLVQWMQAQARQLAAGGPPSGQEETAHEAADALASPPRQYRR